MLEAYADGLMALRDRTPLDTTAFECIWPGPLHHAKQLMYVCFAESAP
jgi:hypothetical protein